MEVMIWIIVFVLMIGIEIATVGLTTIWFAGGALAAFFLAWMGFNIAVQVGVFIGIAVLLLLFTRPMAVRYINSRTEKTNVDSLTGQTALVQETINNRLEEGRVMLRGMEWMARTRDDIVVEAGEEVTVLEVQGVKLIVEPRG